MGGVAPTRISDCEADKTSRRHFRHAIPRFITRMHEVVADLARTSDGAIVLTYEQKDGVGG